MYIGENFVVKMSHSFELRQLVQSNSENGVVQTRFDHLRKVDSMSLSVSARKIRDVPNAGGNSVISEVLSFEMLQRCFGAKLHKTEMEVEYFPEGGSITDYTCEMLGTSLGVSVTRAMKFSGDYCDEDACRLLNKKLGGVIQSSQNSLEKWAKQILHIWATSVEIANVLTRVYNKDIAAEVKANTVVLITVAPDTVEIFANMKKK